MLQVNFRFLIHHIQSHFDYNYYCYFNYYCLLIIAIINDIIVNFVSCFIRFLKIFFKELILLII
jgi:hypothetical protein